MPRSRLSDLLAGKRRITADTAKRLAAAFRMEPGEWLALQAAWDLQQTPDDPSIEPLDPPGFLVGPAGATPLPRPRRPTRLELRVPEQYEVPEDARRLLEERPVEHDEVLYADGTRALIAKRV